MEIVANVVFLINCLNYVGDVINLLGDVAVFHVL